MKRGEFFCRSNKVGDWQWTRRGEEVKNDSDQISRQQLFDMFDLTVV